MIHWIQLVLGQTLSLSGRGTSAAAMNARDAARFLFAVAGSNAVKELADAAVTFIRLVAYRREFVSPGKSSVLRAELAPHWIDGPRHWSVGHRLNPDLDADSVKKRFGLGWVANGATFEDAMVGIIERLASGKLFPPLTVEDFRKPPSRMPHYRKRLWVSLHRPLAYASISYQAETILYEKVFFRSPDEKAISAFTDTLHERSSRHAPLYRQTDFNEVNLAIVSKALLLPSPRGSGGKRLTTK